MDCVVLNFLHLDELNLLVPVLGHKLTVKQPCLLNWDDFVSCRVHQQYFAFDLGQVIDICKVVFLEFDISLVLVVEHTGERADWALKNDCFYSIFCSIVDDRIGSKAKAP